MKYHKEDMDKILIRYLNKTRKGLLDMKSLINDIEHSLPNDIKEINPEHWNLNDFDGIVGRMEDIAHYLNNDLTQLLNSYFYCQDQFNRNQN